MSDIDKLMKKLKTKKKETPKEDEKEKKKETDEKTKIAKDEGLESKKTDQGQKETGEETGEAVPIPAKSEDTEDVVDHEVAVLQNNGVFRRELILTLKELIDVHKVNTQAFLDLIKLVEGADGKGK